MFDIQAAVEQAAAEGPNMNEATSGGDFERELPVEGLVRLRLITYIELGKHESTYKGETKVKDKVLLQFELSGPRHPPVVLEDGRKLPQIINVNETLSLGEKANFFKLFKRLNHTGVHKHFAQLLGGTPLLGTIVHNSTGEGDAKKTYANLRDDAGYTIRPPFVDDPETGESRAVQVDPAITPLKCFLWNFPSKEMWDSLFIDGRWDDKKDASGKVIKEGSSKNYYQNTIKAAKNFAGSPLQELLFAGDALADLPESEAPARTDEDKQAGTEADAGGAAADPLAGV